MPSTLIVICQGKSCQKEGAKRILSLFQEQKTANIEIKTKYCFGKCGQGPMVVILPTETWYRKVQPEQVSVIVQRHFPTN